jgi:hypothetical protein
MVLGLFWAGFAAVVARLAGSGLDTVTGGAIGLGVALVVAFLTAPAMLAGGDDDGG